MLATGGIIPPAMERTIRHIVRDIVVKTKIFTNGSSRKKNKNLLILYGIFHFSSTSYGFTNEECYVEMFSK